jgi:hypothetical protein
MSTRGTIGYVIDGKIYATYNHFDSYPDGLGQDVVDFCKQITKENKWNEFKENAKKVELVKEDDKVPEDIQEKYSGFLNDQVGKQSKDDWYCLLRDIQGISTLEAISYGTVFHMIDGVGFLEDSLFCEFAYILNLDTDEIWFFKGFTHNPLTEAENPFGFSNEKPEIGLSNSSKYYPVKLVGKCKTNKIPKNWISKFYEED